MKERYFTAIVPEMLTLVLHCFDMLFVSSVFLSFWVSGFRSVACFGSHKSLSSVIMGFHV